MSISNRAIVSTGVVALSMTLAACSSSKTTTASTGSHGPTTSSTSSATTDYSNLLIAASDIPVPGFTRGVPAKPPQGNGVTVTFKDSSGTRTLGDTIVVFDSADEAKTAAHASSTAAQSALSDVQTSTPHVGANGLLATGTTSNGGSTLLIFTEGRAEVVLEFDSPADDPVPASVVEQVGARQDATVKTNLPA